MLTVYLGGPINGRTDAECKDWRRLIVDSLSDRMTFRDPMVRDYRGKEGENVEAIVEQDKNDMRASDILLFNCLSGPSFGTAMEIHHGWVWTMPVLVLSPENVSPWVRYHASWVGHDLQAGVDMLEACCGGLVRYDLGTKKLARKVAA